MTEIRKSELIEIKKFISKEILNKVLEEVEIYGYCDSTEVDSFTQEELLEFGMNLVDDVSDAYTEKCHYFTVNDGIYKIMGDYELGKIDTERFDTDSFFIECCSRVSFEKVINAKIVNKRRVEILVDVDFDNNTLEEIEEFLKSKYQLVGISVVK